MLTSKLPPLEVEVPPDLPHEPGNEHGNFMSFKCISREQIGDAKRAYYDELAQGFTPETVDLLQRLNPTAPQTPAEKQAALAARQADVDADPLEGYSARVLVEAGLTGWRGPDYGSVVCNSAEKGFLDTPTLKWAAARVLEASEINLGEVKNSGVGTGTNGSGAAGRRSQDSPASGQPLEKQTS